MEKKKKETFSHHANAHHSCSTDVSDRNPVDSKMSSKAKTLTEEGLCVTASATWSYSTHLQQRAVATKI